MSLKLQNASIIVATHNRSDILEKTLKAMINQDFPGEYEIIVIDQGSRDGSVEMLEKEYRWVTVIKNPVNYGIPKGTNQASLCCS